MKAVRFYAPGDVRVEEIPVPDCNPGEIRVKVDACAVCGSDFKTFRVGNPRMKPPITMGHEFTGIIEGIPEPISGFEKGDRIVMATSISCGECLYCKKGLTNLCINLAPMGFAYNGGMAEYVTIPQKAIANGHLIKVPEGIKAEHAALAEPLSCAVNSVFQSKIRTGDFVLILGGGPMAILNALAARESGASKIFMTELSAPRINQARLFDIDRIIDPSKENLKEIILEETGGYGADVVIVAAPAAAPQEESLGLVRKQGTVCLFASLPKGKSSLNIDSRLIHYNEIHLTGSSDSTAEHVKRAVEMLSSPGFPAEKLVTHIMGLGNINDAFELMEKGETLRVVLKP
ncbi:alcohol dehydrogenase catalytic domain-containing protein [Maribellus comscasis]|uniref:Alcohol dehydrogenase catalytic domain-containing protein n=1 Tax=Maribellus comscasis TaxID=2681766 RepID=A0A6I6JV50_9BACT|nr:alcohol dehydrogenase catalytic domain-containing protein [Maribellus comscasis]QGY46966.1 alcohol dehydrogenase catalytic domain-containing protein [Maribellus comscasis]